jgi:hypothetical protein
VRCHFFLKRKGGGGGRRADRAATAVRLDRHGREVEDGRQGLGRACYWAGPRAGRACREQAGEGEGWAGAENCGPGQSKRKEGRKKEEGRAERRREERNKIGRTIF